MQSQKIATIGNQETLHIIGDGFIMLYGKYDQDQLWFSFMDRAIFRIRPETDEKKETPKTEEIKDRSRAIHDSDPKMRFQYILPFAEARRLTNKQFKRMKQWNYPTWDRLADGNLCTVHVNTGESRVAIVDWCLQTLRMRFFMNSDRTIMFESSTDAMTAKMRFS
jgi:hypothetical protein